MSEADLKESLDGWAKDTQREITLLKLDIAELKLKLAEYGEYHNKLDQYHQKLHKYIMAK
jgi:hypothetical protein